MENLIMEQFETHKEGVFDEYGVYENNQHEFEIYLENLINKYGI